ncbi:unnamed protein product [Lactuca saligna]|uniref:ATP-dependent DNA helicase n=1 Tax=Lactuca saligna TaxID=75948 RepID=A0AA35UXU3_LACSI|nr:unnamed protein product [Lactuca saligna]
MYNNVVSSIDNNKQVLIFVYGHGGTGKTFLDDHSFPFEIYGQNRFGCCCVRNSSASVTVRYNCTLKFLHTNMKLEPSNTIPHSSMNLSDFATWLLAIGDGHIGVPDKDGPRDSSWIEIPSSLLISPSPNSLHTLIDFVYGDDTLNQPTASQLLARAIVCPTNDSTDEINCQVLKMVATPARVYHPYELLLKVDCPIMLLRNINQKEGLCNGTRLIVSQLLPTVIEATIITGTSIGKCVYIPRIKFIHKSSNLPFVFSGKQFPVKVCYAMTINKSQGQSLRKIGIYLSQPIFAHRQLYVALSRATSPDSIRILLNNTKQMTTISKLKAEGIGGPLQLEYYANGNTISDNMKPGTWLSINTQMQSKFLDNEQTRATLNLFSMFQNVTLYWIIAVLN